MKTPHKHADVIKAWADGATVQWKHEHGVWTDLTANPAWHRQFEYRVKPEPQILEGFVVKNLMDQWVFVTSIDHCVTTPKRATLTIHPDE